MADQLPDNTPSPDISPAVPPASDFESRLGEFIGPRWESVYQGKLKRFIADPAFEPTWNWAAALLTPFWFLYRKMYLWFAVFFFVPGALLQWLVPADSPLTPANIFEPQNRQQLLMNLAIQLSTRLAAGGTANWLLFRRGRTAVRVVGMQPMSASDGNELLRRVGGTNRTLTWAMVAVFVVLTLAGTMGSLPV